MRQDVPPPEAGRYTSLTRKFSFFALATVALTGGVLILAVAKDVYWMKHNADKLHESLTHLAILAEVGFILILLCGYTLLIIYSYTRNIRLFSAGKPRCSERFVTATCQAGCRS